MSIERHTEQDVCGIERDGHCDEKCRRKIPPKNRAIVVMTMLLFLELGSDD